MQPSRIPHDQMADELDGMIYSKTTWLADHGQGKRPRPDHEISQQRRYLDVLRQAADDYRKAAGRNDAKSA